MANKNYVLLLNMMKLKNFTLSILKIPKISVFLVILSAGTVVFPGGSYSYERGSIDKEVNPNDCHAMEIEKAKNAKLEPFEQDGIKGQKTVDKKNRILDRMHFSSESYCYTSQIALSNNRNLGIDRSVEFNKELSNGVCARTLILREMQWNSSFSRKVPLWQKMIDGKFSEIGAVSNDGENVFLLNDDQSRIAWWKLEIIDPGVVRFWKEKYGQEVTQIHIDVPKEYIGNIASLAYLDSFNTLCLFDRKQDVSCLIYLKQYDQKLEEITIVIDDTYGESNA